MALRQCGQSVVVDSTLGSVFRRAMREFTGFTTKKNTAAAMETNAISTLMKSP